jgi:phosphoenolpyruvate carboxylase
VLGRFGVTSAYAEASEDERARLLTAEIQAGRSFAPRLDFSPGTNETLDLFRLVRRTESVTNRYANPALARRHPERPRPSLAG